MTKYVLIDGFDQYSFTSYKMYPKKDFTLQQAIKDQDHIFE